ncbi:MAG: class I adenylate-forming enzyme family protein [Rhodoglobus sp.]|uniref:class I adenylate-forming enzyme family protein n=1 Tax=Salinibacterium sp. G-O1 TaxID=3046208 RepID=UPI0024BB1CA3|nr:class I adenylate-forming enzyme family protein [Salinibacterium sp. G-O1]MDJ0335944.1 class I adenylate-forming enzyme family protein [Salinibacterium sp. G-O1]
MTDILAAVLAACDRWPDAPAMTLGRRTLSYAQLRSRVLGVAGALAERGLQPGDRVLFSVRPGLDGISLALGIIAASGTVVFADPGAGEAMFRARAALAAPRWVAAESLLYAASAGALRGIARRRGLELPDYASVVPGALHLHAGPWLPGVPNGSIPVRTLLAEHGGGTLAGDPSGEALIIFTSGTTSHPKAVVHSRSSLGTGLADFADRVGFVAGERVLTDQLMVGIPALISGAHWRLPPAGADPGAKPAAYLDLLPRADVLFAVPAALDAMLRMLEREPAKTPTLRALLIGGAPVLRPLLERVRRQLPGTRVLAIYGMTEILPVAIADATEKLDWTEPGDLVGELMSTVDARIEEGELVVAGPGLALGYLGQPPLNELHTGDLALIDGRRLVLSGRSKDMFIRGTTNVYPGLYEPVIAGIPGVAEAAMVGVPDEVGDDAIVLVIVPGAGFDEAAVRRALPGLIDAAVMPDRIQLMDALPRAGRSSKLDRAALTAIVAGSA